MPREDFLRGLTLDGRGGVKGARVGGRRRKFSVVVDRGTRDKLGSGAKGAAHDEAGAEEEEDEVDDDFDPIAYLSSLPPRHQTLEDLRAELRQRSADISAELMELVNREYAAFLGLGDGLRGGEERVEDVRVGMLGFRRAVEEVRARVRARRKEVEALTAELAAVRVGIEKARRMAECEDRLVALERKLLVASLPGGKTGKPGEDDEDADGFSDGFSDEDEDGDTDAELDTGNRPAVAWLGGSPAKLSALAKELLAIRRLADSIDKQTPFVRKLEERVARCRNTILLDLGTALMEARKAPGGRGTERVLGYLAIYRTFGAESEAVKTLKGA